LAGRTLAIQRQTIRIVRKRHHYQLDVRT